jgi:hypothetical protein
MFMQPTIEKLYTMKLTGICGKTSACAVGSRSNKKTETMNRLMQAQMR